MHSDILLIFFLLIAFQLKHFLADYPLQMNAYMQGKFNREGWVMPLLSHVAVHGFFTLLICLVFVPVWLAVVLSVADMTIHFVMDRIKASPDLLGRYKDKDQPAYWNTLGLDQAVHHLTHYGIILTIVLYFS
jgi:hypothetical protein